ncbi:MAG: ATP-binding protein [Verrucomicrobia bacterium]|nr:ATP-binding protein [Verrucomicrobiota bacterium]
MKESLGQKLIRLWSLLKAAAREPADVEPQVVRVERNLILPVRLAAVAMLYHSFHFSPWIRLVSYSLDVGVETVVSLFWIYAAASIGGGVIVLAAPRFPAALTRGTIIFLSLLDALFLAGLTLITGGYDSILYWAFVVLLLRNLFTIPLSPVQLLIQACTAGCYVLAGVGDFVLAATVDEPTRLLLGLEWAQRGTAAEVMLVRTVLLALVALCGFGVQLLLERQRRAEAEAREHQLREGQLKSAGRLAAEIAHQLKNPLAIINNTVFNLQRRLGSEPQLQGRVERLDAAELLEEAAGETFPPGAGFQVALKRSYAPGLPPVMMQREHLKTVLLNLLTNAREATGTSGLIQLKTRAPAGGGVEIVVADSGPGIPREQQARIFEAYYTTKPKGTGLGLAIAKSNVELYGGTLRVESELGKGSEFTLFLPATISRPS